jgi:hypothetical protein
VSDLLEAVPLQVPERQVVHGLHIAGVLPHHALVAHAQLLGITHDRTGCGAACSLQRSE